MGLQGAWQYRLAPIMINCNLAVVQLANLMNGCPDKDGHPIFDTLAILNGKPRAPGD